MRHPLRLIAFLVGFTVMAMAQTPQEVFVIDFEGFAEDTPISTQYQNLGVTFSIVGQPGVFPIIAVEGGPWHGFVGSGNDTPMSSGSGGLTDPPVGGDYAIGSDIRIDFSPPVDNVQLFVIDIDGSDVVTVQAFSGATLATSVTRTAGQPGTGNGVSSSFDLAATGITSVVIDVPSGSVGYAVDFVRFSRPCIQPSCLLQYRIAQESAPDVGDFDANVLGNLVAWPFGGSAANFYAYDVPEGASWNGIALNPVADRSHVLLADTTDGLSLVVVHDRAIPDDPDGGRAEMRFDLLGDPDGAVRTVGDDPTESSGGYTGAPGSNVFTSAHFWSPCCTDGLVLSDLESEWALFLEFTEVLNPSTPPIAGLTEWVAYSADGTQIPLVLALDRRVRIDVVAAISCAQDLGYAGPVGNLALSLCGDPVGQAGGTATFLLQGAPPATQVFLALGPVANPLAIPGGGVLVPWPPSTVLDTLLSDANGRIQFPVPGGLLPSPLYLQCATFVGGSFEFSNAIANL